MKKVKVEEGIQVIIPQDSIEVSRNAKGDYNFKVKIYFDSDEGKGSMDKVVMKKIETIYKELVKKFK